MRRHVSIEYPRHKTYIQLKRIIVTLLLLLGPILHGQQDYKSFRSFDQTSIAYTDEGQGIPVLLIHGFISSGRSWEQTPLKKLLLENGFRVIIPDLRGNGNSDHPTDPSAYADDAEVKDLMALADYLKLSTYMAIGYSRGSIVLAKLLTRDPRITTAVLGGMGLDFTNPDWDRRIAFQEAFSGQVPPDELTSGAINYAKSIGADLVILGMLQEFQPVTSLEELQKIQAKVLVIAGDMDQDNGMPMELMEQIEGAKIKIVPGDHNGTYKTDRFAAEILSFLEQ